MAAKCSDPAHKKAMDVLHSLSQTQFGRAALERHGHNPASVEEARAYQSQQPPAPVDPNA